MLFNIQGYFVNRNNLLRVLLNTLREIRYVKINNDLPTTLGYWGGGGKVVLLTPVISLRTEKGMKLQKTTIFLHLVSICLQNPEKNLQLRWLKTFNGIEGHNRWFSSFIASGKGAQCNVKMKQQYKWKQKQW